MSIELHERFADWLAVAGADEPPRDVALHASACSECRLLAGAYDALGAIDLSHAAMPPMTIARREEVEPGSRAGRLAGVAAGVTLLGAAVAVSALRTADRGVSTIPAASPSVDGDVLAGGGSPGTTGTESPSATSQAIGGPDASGSQSASAEPGATAASGSPAGPDATAGPGVAPPIGPTPTNPPTSAPPGATARPTPVPTARPTVAPTPAPTAIPTPTPVANLPPVAVDDSFAAIAGLAATGNVLANDSDPDGDALTVQAWGPPSVGSFVTTSPNGDFTWQHLTDPTFVGTVTFDYVVSDGQGGTDTGTVTITVSLPLP